MPPYETDLFEALRVLRKRLADEQGVPPYTVFSDATLRELAAKKPRTQSAFRAIGGVGDVNSSATAKCSSPRSRTSSARPLKAQAPRRSPANRSAWGIVAWPGSHCSASCCSSRSRRRPRERTMLPIFKPRSEERCEPRRSSVVTVNVKPGAGAPTGGTIVYTVVAPNRFRQEVSGSIGSDDTIVIGNQVYGHDNGAWDVQTWSDHLVTGYEARRFWWTSRRRTAPTSRCASLTRAPTSKR